MLYMEQMMRMFPKEITARYRLIPAFEESLMREEESRGDEMKKR